MSMTYLLSTTDAREWAEQFMLLFADRRDQIDHGLMLTWFANAIETGRMHHDGVSAEGMHTGDDVLVRGTVLPSIGRDVFVRTRSGVDTAVARNDVISLALVKALVAAVRLVRAVDPNPMPLMNETLDALLADAPWLNTE